MSTQNYQTYWSIVNDFLAKHGIPPERLALGLAANPRQFLSDHNVPVALVPFLALPTATYYQAEQLGNALAARGCFDLRDRLLSSPTHVVLYQRNLFTRD